MTMSEIDSLFSGLRVSSEGLLAERARVDVIAENIANANTTRTSGGGPYRRKQVVFERVARDAFSRRETPRGPGAIRVTEDHSTPFVSILSPGHPDADANGSVLYPNVNAVLEMTDLITALRAYEANLAAQEGFVRMAERALEIAR
jgi:flagellar basal-body rod protein FlgC